MSIELEDQKQVPLAQRPFFWPALAGTLLLLLACAIAAAFFALAERSAANRQLLSELLTVQATQATAVAISILTTPSPLPTSGQTVALPTQTSQVITVPAPPTLTPTFGRKASDVQIVEPTKVTAPVLQDDAYAVDEDTILSIFAANGLLANDTQALTVGIEANQVTQPVQGSLTVSSDGAFIYEPLPNFYGDDFFTYEACSVFNLCAVGSVTITVRPVNDPPVADDDTLAVEEDDAATDITAVLLAGDMDVEDNLIGIADVETVNPERVIFSAVAGTVQYDPGDAFNSLAAGETAVDIFQYTVDDGKEISNTATVTVTIQGENDPPIAQNDGIGGGQSAFELDEDTVSGSLSSSLLSNDADPDDGDAPLLKIYAVSNNGDGGTAVLIGDDVTYDPGDSYTALAEGETASDTFTYSVIDPSGGISNAATVEVTIRGINQPPNLQLSNLTNPIIFSSTITTVVNIATTAVITDVDNDTLTDLTIRFAGGTPRPDGQDEYVQLTFQGAVITSTGDIISLSSSTPLPMATYVAAIQTAQYVNNSPTPTAGCRQFDFQVFDADGGASTVQSITVQVDTAVCSPQVKEFNLWEVWALTKVRTGTSRRLLT